MYPPPPTAHSERSKATRGGAITEQGPAPQLQRARPAHLCSPGCTIFHRPTSEAETWVKDSNTYTKLNPSEMSHWKLNTSQREIRAKAGQDFVLTTASTAQRGLERSSRLVGHTRATVLHSTTGASKSSSCKIQPLASSSISLHCPLRVSGDVGLGLQAAGPSRDLPNRYCLEESRGSSGQFPSSPGSSHSHRHSAQAGHTARQTRPAQGYGALRMEETAVLILLCQLPESLPITLSVLEQVF